MMGSPEDEPERDDGETLHQVTISRPFYLQTTPVTQGQWKKVMGSNPSSFKGDDNLPVEEVFWHESKDFIGRLNQQEGAAKYRLPTEAEWEYACRAGSTTAYCFGDDSGGLGEYAWYRDNSEERTHPVGKKKPNAWGLYDMHGNVCEQVKDYGYTDYQLSPVIDPDAPPSGIYIVFRGGSWRRNAGRCRSADRGDLIPVRSQIGSMGFRLLRIVESKLTKKQLAKSNGAFVAEVRETSRDGDFIAYNNGTVLDTRTNLIWAEEDNDFGINWTDAESYCENYRGGGYLDWRMPTLDELEELYESGNYKNVLQITGCFVWASETRGSDVAGFYFITGERSWNHQSAGSSSRALPVRSGK